MFCFYVLIHELNMNLIDYILNPTFEGYILTFIDMFI
jgi:hypothetical protein